MAFQEMSVQAPVRVAVNPTVTVTVPVANPCAANASFTVAYSYAGGTANTLLSIYAHNNSSGPGRLIYAGVPSTNLPASASPVTGYTVSAASDNGLSGTKTFTPSAGYSWPGAGGTTRWEAVITTTANTKAVHNGTQVTSAAATDPTVTVTVPVANPCAPNASMTVAYSSAAGTAGCLLSVYAHNNAGGLGRLIYAADPSTNLPAAAGPITGYTISAASDNGTSGTKTFTPNTGYSWPGAGSTTLWRAILTTPALLEAVHSGTQITSAAAVDPTVTVVAPVANPCGPQAAFTVNYGSVLGTAGTKLSVYVYNTAGGIGKLIYAADPTTNSPSSAGPVPEYTISAASDNGTTGTKTFTPVSGVYWPGAACRWEAIITTADKRDAVHSATQNVDISTVPVPDVTVPAVSNISPSPGSTIGAGQAITFDVTDNIGLALNIVYAEYAGMDEWDVIHNGTSFAPNFITGSTRTAITNGFRYVVRKFGGWPSAPTINAKPVDTSGNVA